MQKTHRTTTNRRLAGLSLALALSSALAVSMAPVLGVSQDALGASPASAQEDVQVQASAPDGAADEVERLTAGDGVGEGEPGGESGQPSQPGDASENAPAEAGSETSLESEAAGTAADDSPDAVPQEGVPSETGAPEDSVSEGEEALAPVDAVPAENVDVTPAGDAAAIGGEEEAPAAIAEASVTGATLGGLGADGSASPAVAAPDEPGATGETSESGESGESGEVVDVTGTGMAESVGATDPEQADASLAAEPIASGEWGTCHWSISAGGTLTISEGEGDQFQNGSAAPWYSHRESIKTVVADGTVVLPSNCRQLFVDYTSLVSFDASGFDASKVSSMFGMFHGCSSLKTIDLSGWDTSSLTVTSTMFAECSSLAFADLSGWNTSSLEGAYSMFYDCSKLSSVYLTGWDVSSCEQMSSMFSGCSSLASLNVSGWDVSSATQMVGMFMGCSSLRSLDLSGWDMSGADASALCRGCSGLTSLSLANAVLPENCSSMFAACTRLTSLDTTGLDTSHMTRTISMFDSCKSLTSLDVSGWDMSKVTSAQEMFWGCSSLASLDVSGWKTTSLTNATRLFSGCSSLASLDLSGWDVSSVTSMRGMFVNCSSLASLDITGWETPLVSDMSYAFSGCSSLGSLDLSGWDTSSATTVEHMFDDCSSLAEVKLGTKFAFVNDVTLPSYEVNSRTDWFSVADQDWYTSEQIASDRSGVADTYLKVAAKDLSDATVTLPKDAYDYTGSAIEPEPTVVLDGKTLKAQTDYTVSYSDNVEAGTATVTVTGTGNYVGKAEATFTINAPDKVSLAQATVTLSPAELIFDGTAQRPEVTVEIGGKTLTEGADYSVTWSGGPTFGVIAAEVTGMGDYTGSTTGTCRITFLDTPADAWYITEGWLDHVVNTGMMTGIRDGSGAYTGYFEPDATTTRGQVATILFRYYNPTSDVTTNPAHYGRSSHFPDVPGNMYYTAAIEWCAMQGIVTGYLDTGNFGPEDPITREQLAAMVWRLAKLHGADTTASASALSKAPDGSQISGWARDAMAWCATNGVITGYAQDGRVDPQGNATRAQVAKIVTVVTRDVL